MTKKRPNSAYLPYRFIDGLPYVYLQRRTKDAPHSPGHLGTFGGREEPTDNGNPEATLIREVMEELTVVPKNYQLFHVWEDDERLIHFYMEEVSEDWESHVNVKEGDCGQFYSEEAVNAELLMTERIRETLRHLFKELQHL